MAKSFQVRLDEFKDCLLNEIYALFDKHAKKDNLGELSIQSGDMSDESLYLMIDFEPEWNDDIEDEVLYPCEIIEFVWKNDEIDVKTFERGSMFIGNLSIDDLLRCREYLMYLEDNETEE